MKLNHDCVRELLLVIEEFQEIGDNLEIFSLPFEQVLLMLPPNLYNNCEVIYASKKLEEAGLVNVDFFEDDNEVCWVIYSGLSYAGHEYLDAIRSKDVWFKIKNVIIKNGGSLAFSVIQQMAVKLLLT